MKFGADMYEVDNANNCWVWTGGTCNKYGYINSTYAHRISYEFHKGENSATVSPKSPT